MFTPKFNITSKITKSLTSIERARGFLEAATLSEEWIRAMSEKAFILEAHHTTHIEGTQLTVEQSEQLLKGKKVEEADSEDVRELLNYRSAFNFVSEYLNSGAPVSENLIREIHKRLVEGVRGGTSAPGEYRKIQNYVVNSATGETIYTPPPAYDVPILMSEFVDWINKEEQTHPVIVSGIAQFQLVHIHPFLDGNGRTSRLLSTLCLYREGYDFKRLFTISEYYDRDRTAFYSVLQSVREQGLDLTGWIEYFVEGLAVQMQEVTKRGESAIKGDILSKKYSLSKRQALALEYLLDNGEMSIADFERICPDVNRRTLQRDLKQMESYELIRKKGSARRSAYVFRNKI